VDDFPALRPGREGTTDGHRKADKETVNINDAELRGFVERALAFAKR